MIFGVDPGISGAVAYLTSNGAEVFDMPTNEIKVGKRMTRTVNSKLLADEIMEIAHAYRDKVVAIEKVHSMPKQGVSSTFKFGMAYGEVLGVFGALGFRVIHVTPQQWKKAFSLIGQPKDASLKAAIDLYPCCAKDLKRKKDNGRADALLIAHYGLKNL